MASDPYSANYGRANYGQIAPYRDTAKRRHSAFDQEDEQEQQPAQEEAPAPLAQAIYPKQKPVFSKQQTQPIVDRVQNEAKSGSLASVTGGAGGYGKAVPPTSRTSANTTVSDEPSTSALEKAIAPTARASSGSGSLTQPVGLGQFNLEGYNYDRFADPNGRGNNTWKYRIGSVMSNYDPNDPAQVNAMVADLQAKGVPVTFDGKDKLTFGPEVTDENGNQIGTIDVIRGAGAAGAGWAWQPLGGESMADPLATAVGGSAADPVAEMLAKQLGIDTANPLWKQILDQLIADQSGKGGDPQFATVRV